MKILHTRWILIVVFSALIIIDILDGDILKIITTVLLSASVVAFSFGYTSPKQRSWFAVGSVLGVLAIAGIVYRLVLISGQH